MTAVATTGDASIVVAISLSIVAHSSTDVPIAGYFARLERRDKVAASHDSGG